MKRIRILKQILRKSQYLKTVKREEYFEHAKYAQLLRENSIVLDLYQSVNVQGMKHNMNAPNVSGIFQEAFHMRLKTMTVS